ncbi:PP2C family protein-serine/threonine phosphatase [Thermanaerovibrio velox]|uniref:PP2C family protein-serine/threonine phosphatase n=1 Tax=Thermanaerovibrio velox TaxID=108007 RepID=UPI0002F27CA2|nr:protein phosphatase 2C domain-containing protein [Thermanaerovibrio velox]
MGARRYQEDAFGYGEGPNLYGAVADGMGGMLMGAEASRIAVEAAMGALRGGGTPLQAVMRAQEDVQSWARGLGILGLTGTTLSVAAVDLSCGLLDWASVGDSRIYLFRRGGSMELLSRDHTVAEAVRASGGDPASLGAEGDLITSFIGIEELAEISIPEEPVRLEKGDVVLLVSDGVHRVLSPAEMAALMDREDPASALMWAVSSKGIKRQDNATAVVLAI